MQFLPPLHYGLVVFANKCRLFCTCTHAQCRVHFFHHVKFYFRFGQLIGFPVWGQLCCGYQGEESWIFFSCNVLLSYQRLSSIKGCLPSKVVFCQKLSSIKGYLPSKVFFHKRSSSLKGHLLSKVVFCQRSSFVKGRLPSKVIFRQRSSSVKGRLPSKVVFRRRSSSVKGRLPLKVIFHQWSPSIKLPTSCLWATPEVNQAILSLVV